MEQGTKQYILIQKVIAAQDFRRPKKKENNNSNAKQNNEASQKTPGSILW